MNILLLGSGGREHALAWALAKCPCTTRLLCAPGNPGMAEFGACMPLDLADHDAVLSLCRSAAIDFVVVGPEVPLVAGIVDRLAAAGIRAFGPSAAAARLEGSKGFTKDLCRQAGIPTADYGRFSDAGAALAYSRSKGAPLVVKADGLAAGKGVVVAETLAEAEAAIASCFAGTSAAEVVIEEKLLGVEVSFFALSDGRHAVAFGSARDHKRVGDGDTGPNTGGMGAYSPAPEMTLALTERVMAEIIRPTVAAMAQRGTPFTGVLFAGLMLTTSGPQLIEYNVRFGDPETQAMLLRLDSDLASVLLATCDGTLASTPINWSSDHALTVVMASVGYPGATVPGGVIGDLDRAARQPGVIIFHAGTAQRGGALIANGGRVLNIAARGATLAEARARAYTAVDCIDWTGGFARRDIGATRVEA